ncbi:Type IV pilus assembly PilZ domain protein [Candidatus Magnetoovum chiemensis]|nr:Type IV pilus assembly PilZ domain protein [Candidatus Magnetoovum chiemensis]
MSNTIYISCKKELEDASDTKKEQIYSELEKAFKHFNEATEYLEPKEHAELNCWDFNNCPKDKRAACPVISQSAGNRCWLVAGTLNGLEVSCLKVKRKEINNCKDCAFYKIVKGHSSMDDMKAIIEQIEDRRKKTRDKVMLPVSFSHDDFSDPLNKNAMIGNIINLTDEGASVETIIRSEYAKTIQPGALLTFLFKPKQKRKAEVLRVTSAAGNKLRIAVKFLSKENILAIHPPYSLAYKCPHCRCNMVFEENLLPEENSIIECSKCKTKLKVKINKRDFYRKNVSIPVRFSFNDFDDFNYRLAKTGTITDISRTGMMMEVKRETIRTMNIVEGTNLTFIIILSPDTPEIKVKATVCRIISRDNDIIRYGIEFNFFDVYAESRIGFYLLK